MRSALICSVLYTLIIFSALSCADVEKKSGRDHSSGTGYIEIAEGIQIDRYESYSRIIIRDPWQGADNVNMTCYLVKRGEDPPPGINPGEVVFVPVRKIICMSTTHAGMITALGEESTIDGLSGRDLIYSPALAERVKSGLVSEIGYESDLNLEVIIRSSPDLVMIYGVGGETASHLGKLNELGIKVMFNGDYLEKDPLGKAEWIKLFGCLYNKEHIADSIFNSAKRNYLKIRDEISRNAVNKPSVLLGMPFKDTWFISPGNSFVSALIEDAGGSYIWRNTISDHSMPYGLEDVYVNAMNADYWLNIGTVSETSEITMVDERLSDLKCFRTGNLYNNNRRINEHGGNDYWESGAVMPDRILMDIAIILHPYLFPEEELHYYRKLE